MFCHFRHMEKHIINVLVWHLVVRVRTRNLNRLRVRGGDGPLGVVFPGWPELGPTRSASEVWSVLSRPLGLPANTALSCLPGCVGTPEGVVGWGA